MRYHCPLLPDHIYHVYNHAVGSENLFRDADNYAYFLELDMKHLLPIAEFYAYNLLPNHFHFLIKIKSIDALTARYKIQKGRAPIEITDWPKFTMQQFSNFFNAYAKAYNKRFDRRGALFIDYLKRSQIDTTAYIKHCIHYIHNNAVHHGLCSSIDGWHWTSYQSFLKVLPSKLSKEVVLENFDGQQQFITFHNGKPKITGDALEFI